MKLSIILLTIYIFTIVQINALEKEVFMSTKFDKVNVRKGPGLKYDIIYQFLIVGVPLKIKKEFENWKMVEDYEGGIGWIAKSQLTNKSIKQRIGYTFIVSRQFRPAICKSLARVKSAFYPGSRKTGRMLGCEFTTSRASG